MTKKLYELLEYAALALSSTQYLLRDWNAEIVDEIRDASIGVNILIEKQQDIIRTLRRVERALQMVDNYHE